MNNGMSLQCTLYILTFIKTLKLLPHSVLKSSAPSFSNKNLQSNKFFSSYDSQCAFKGHTNSQLFLLQNFFMCQGHLKLKYFVGKNEKQNQPSVSLSFCSHFCPLHQQTYHSDVVKCNSCQSLWFCKCDIYFGILQRVTV